MLGNVKPVKFSSIYITFDRQKKMYRKFYTPPWQTFDKENPFITARL